MLVGLGINKWLNDLGVLGQISHPSLGLGSDAALHNLIVLSTLLLGLAGCPRLAGRLLGRGLLGLRLG